MGRGRPFLGDKQLLLDHQPQAIPMWDALLASPPPRSPQDKSPKHGGHAYDGTEETRSPLTDTQT